VELLAQRLNVELPDGQGRAARRLNALREVTRAVLDGRLARPLPISGGLDAVAP